MRQTKIKRLNSILELTKTNVGIKDESHEGENARSTLGNIPKKRFAVLTFSLSVMM